MLHIICTFYRRTFQSLIALGLSFGEKTSSSAGNNAVLAMMFSGIYIGQVAPTYVQNTLTEANHPQLGQIWSWDSKLNNLTMH